MTVVPAAASSGTSLGGGAVRQGEEDRVDRRQGRVDLEAGPCEVRMRRTDRFGVAGAALEPDDLDVRVARRGGG